MNWLHFYNTDYAVTPAFTAYGYQNHSVAQGVVDVPTKIRNAMLHLRLARTKNTQAVILWGCAPAEVYTAMSTYTIMSSSFFNTYGKYIWAHQSVHFGTDTAANGGGYSLTIDLNPTTGRDLTPGDRIFWIVAMRDVENSTTAASLTYMFEYDYLEVNQTA